MDMNLSEFQEMVEDQGAWCAAGHGVTKGWTWLSRWTTAIAMWIHTVLNTTALQEGKYYREKQQHFLIHMIFLLFLSFPHLWKIGDTEKCFFTVRKHFKHHEEWQLSLVLDVRTCKVVRTSAVWRADAPEWRVGGGGRWEVGGRHLSHCPHARSRQWGFRPLHF